MLTGLLLFDSFPASLPNDTALTRPQDWKNIDWNLFERVPDSDKWINPKDRVAKEGVQGRGKLIEVVLWEPRGDRMRREAGEEGGTFGRGHILFTPPATRLKHVWTQFRMFCLFLQFQYILF